MHPQTLDDAPSPTFTPVPGIPCRTQVMQQAMQALIHEQLAQCTSLAQVH